MGIYRMRSIGQKKNNHALIILFVIVAAILFGFFFDHIYIRIECLIYPRPEEYREFVEKYSHTYDVPVELVYSVIKTESNFDPAAVSAKGAIGLMQMMPKTFEWITNDLLCDYHNVEMLYDPETNIKYGTYYLSRLLNKFNDLDTAIAAYNGGEGNVGEWLKDKRYSDDGVKLNIDDIPSEYSETKQYVKKVNKALSKYRELYTDK